MYLRGGGYLGYKGVTHGLWMGSEWADGETWNVGDAVVANEVHSTGSPRDHHRFATEAFDKARSGPVLSIGWMVRRLIHQ